jgi:hypothetical protein
MADPHKCGPASNRYALFEEDEMDAEDEFGEKSGGKGAKNETGGENMEMVVLTGDNDEADGKRSQRQVVQKYEGNVGDRDYQDSKRDNLWTTKIGNFGTWDTGTWDNTASASTTMQTDGEPTESDVIDNVSGSISFRDRSFGREFLMAGKKKSSASTTTKTATAAAAAAMATAAAATVKTMMKKASAATRMATIATKPTRGGMHNNESVASGQAENNKQAAEGGDKGSKTSMETICEELINTNRQEEAEKARGSMRSISKAQREKVEAVTTAAAKIAEETRIAAAKKAIASARAAVESKMAAKAAVKAATKNERNYSHMNYTPTTRANSSITATASKVAPIVVHSARMSRDEHTESATRVPTERAEETELEKGAMRNHSGGRGQATEGTMGESKYATDGAGNTEAKDYGQQEDEQDYGIAYKVRYEYSKKPHETTRATSVELRVLAQELWRADPALEIVSLNPDLCSITQIDEFPVREDQFKQFFEQAVTELQEGQRKYVIGFAIRSEYNLQELKVTNGKALQTFAQERKTWLVYQRFATLATEQIGWFACKFAGAHCKRFEQELWMEITKTIAVLNQTEEFEGAKRIKGILMYEVTRSTVYGRNGQSDRTSALTIRCENHNTEWMKTILIAADLDSNKFGTFMLTTTKLSNPELHWTMFQKHAAFTQNEWTIVVEGLHDTVLEAMIELPPGSGNMVSVKDSVLNVQRRNVSPIKSIEYTTRSDDEGRFLFVTTRAGIEATESIIAKELVSLARQTIEHHNHFTDGEKFLQGIRQATRRTSRRERHENGVRARHSQLTEDERARAKQGTRRPVIILDAPWTLEEYPLLPVRNEIQTIQQSASYAQATAGIQGTAAGAGTIQHQHQQQHHQYQQGQQQQQGRSSPLTNRSIASELGHDDAMTIQSMIGSMAEQSEKMQQLIDGYEGFKANVETAVELRLKEQQQQHQNDLLEMEKRQKEASELHFKQLKSKDETHQLQLNEILQQFGQRDEQLRQEKIVADNLQRERDKAITIARETESLDYKATIAQLILESNKTASTLLSEFRQMMSAGPLPVATTTPLRPTTLAPQSLPSRINVNTEMEEASQITSTLSGIQGYETTNKSESSVIPSPPRISKKRQAYKSTESKSTENTIESTKASSNTSEQTRYESSNEGLATQVSPSRPIELAQDEQGEKIPGKDGSNKAEQRVATTDTSFLEELVASAKQDHEGTLEISGTSPDAEAMAKFAKSPTETKHTQELEEGEIQEECSMGGCQPGSLQDHEDLLPIPGTAHYAEAMEKFSDTSKVLMKDFSPSSYLRMVRQTLNELRAAEPPIKNCEETSNSNDDDTNAILSTWGGADSNGDSSSGHVEDKQLESIWKTNKESMTSPQEQQPNQEIEVELKAGGENAETTESKPHFSRESTPQGEHGRHSTEDGQIEQDKPKSSREHNFPRTEGKCDKRDKRHRELPKTAQAREIKKVTKEGAAAIIQKVGGPRDSTESPDRKKRAAPSPGRVNTTDEDESSMTSSAAGDIANAVITQIQEAPKEAKAPSGPRKDV